MYQADEDRDAGDGNYPARQGVIRRGGPERTASPPPPESDPGDPPDSQRQKGRRDRSCSAAAHSSFPLTAIACLLAFTEKLFITHHRLVRMPELHMRHIGIIIGYTDQHSGGMSEVSGNRTRFTHRFSFVTGPATAGRDSVVFSGRR